MLLEAHELQRRLDLLLRESHGTDRLVRHDVLHGGERPFLFVFPNAMLHKGNAELGFRGEAFKLLVVDCPKQGRLPAIIGATQAVAASALEVESRVVEQGEGTVAKGEATVTEVLTLLLLLLVDFLVLTAAI